MLFFIMLLFQKFILIFSAINFIPLFQYHQHLQNVFWNYFSRCKMILQSCPNIYHCLSLWNFWCYLYTFERAIYLVKIFIFCLLVLLQFLLLSIVPCNCRRPHTLPSGHKCFSVYKLFIISFVTFLSITWKHRNPHTIGSIWGFVFCSIRLCVYLCINAA